MQHTLHCRQSPKLAKRAEGDGQGQTIEGYGAVFYDGTRGTEYELWTGVVERIMPGTFDRAIAEDDVRSMFNHDMNILLGRNRSGTLRLSVDERGLRYEVDLDPASRTHQDVAIAIGRGDVDGSSFWFQVTDEDRRVENEIVIYEIRGVRLFECGPVCFPAYEATTSNLRSAHVAARRLDVEQLKRGEDWQWRGVALRARARALEIVE